MMLYSVFQYLIESTLYLLAVLVLYRMLLSKLTHFAWMRAFLLGGMVLGIVLPLFTLPLAWHRILPGAGTVNRPLQIPLLNDIPALTLRNPGIQDQNTAPVNDRFVFIYLLGIAYISVFSFRLLQLIRKLLLIRGCIRHHPGEKRDRYWFIQSTSTSAAFSFFNYIFLGRQLETLNPEERVRIVSHETAHADLYHTVDNLLLELITAFFWFNPLMSTFKTYLQEVHEFSADEYILKDKEMKQAYSRLLLRLTSRENPPLPSSAFSAKQISRRIKMIERERTLPGYKLLFLLLLPVAACLLVSFSYLENRSTKLPVSGEDQAYLFPSINQQKVGTITWINNTVYTDDQLNQALGIATGDTYSREYLDQRLYTDLDAASSLYLDHGYLFFYAEIEESPGDDGTMDLNITIYEGIQVKIRNISIKGNGNVPEAEIMEKILIGPGELFSRIKIIQSVRAISRMDPFDGEHIAVNPTPIRDPLTGESAGVDIEFDLAEN